MTRAAKDDLKILVKHLKEYSISSIVSDTEFEAQLRRNHSKYLSLLTFLAEISDQYSKNNSASHLPTPLQQSYLNESASDLGQAFFSWTHGGYKACRIMLRSSIETFTKGVCCEEITSILTEKKLHVVFKQATGSAALKPEPNQTIFKQLHSQYGTLCSDVHTATASNMANVSSLDYFPSFDKSTASGATEAFLFATSRMTTLLALIYNQAFHEMHHRNKEIIRDSVIGKYKSSIQNIE